MGITIDHGIDLGTTNSAIARQDGTKTRLLKGRDGSELLPSAVYVDNGGAVVVGAAAYAGASKSPADTATEFKRLMGTDDTRTFPGSGKRMTPEELSAEVLKELLRWAAADGGHTPNAAVITIPAMFQLPQCEATRRAAEMAGILHAPLLQEPIAAAIAQSGAGKVLDGSWLVYDLGGGTFDVSLVRSRAGRLQVLDHGGDNHLGGRDFDRMVARSIADRIRREGRLGDFKRTDPALADAFTRLRLEAERVRIALSKEEQVLYKVDDLARDAGGAPVSFEVALDRGELESLVEPLIVRTTAMCAELLSRSGITAKELRGIVMVGGPTLTPCIPRIIERELGIEARHHMDPMNIVATGAAIFASTQQLPEKLRTHTTGSTVLKLEYEPMTTNPSPLLAGKIEGATKVAKIRITRSGGGYDSGAIAVKKGAFGADLELKQRELNVFILEGFDADGGKVAVEPSQITVLHGFSVAKPPLSQSVGVMLADNNVCWYLRKGAVLPARNTMVHTTTIELPKGHSGDAIHVPLVQGESNRADRNKVIGVLRIVAEKIERDLPRGTEVQVSMSIDEFSRTTSRAFVPLLDQWFDDVVFFHMETKKADDVGKGLSAQKDRLAELEKLAAGLEEAEAAEAPAAGASAGGPSPAPSTDSRVKEIEALLEEGDRDAVDLADQMVRWMSREIDQAEDGNRGKALETEFAKEYESARELSESPDNAAERRQAEAHAAEFRHAIKAKDFDAAKKKLEDLTALVYRLLRRLPGYWAAVFSHLTDRLTQLNLAHVAAAHIQKGRTLVQNGAVGDLAQVCFDMAQLLPESEKKHGGELPGIVSHVK
jgi:molecular chaperone DnaK